MKKKWVFPTIVVLFFALFILQGRMMSPATGANEEGLPSGVVAKTQGNIQHVTTRFSAGGYVPIVVKENIPVRWTIQMAREDLNGCNNAMVIPELGIEKSLNPGENVIEFTPKSSGTIAYSCWMGMIRSHISVVK